MDDKKFNRSAAKAAGYSDEEIDAFLASRPKSKQPAVAERPTRQMPQISVPADVTRAPRAQSLSERAQEAGKREERQERFWQELGMIPAALANISRDIPGVEAAQAGVRSLVRRQPYREALQDIRSAAEALPAEVAVPTRVAGAALSAAAMPGRTAARQAMSFGALSGATEANPDIGIEERAGRTALGAAAGGAAAKATQTIGTVGRAYLAPRMTERGVPEIGVRTRAEQLLRQKEATESAAGPLYRGFREMGELPETPALQEILQLPVVRTAIRTVKKESPRLAKLSDTDAAVLDAVYKRIGSKAFSAKHGFETGEARNALFQAIDEASFEKSIITGTGELFRRPVGTYRQGMESLGATQRGARAVQLAGSPQRGTTVKSALEESPEATIRWAKRASPAERKAAIEGALAEVRQRGLSDITQPFGLKGSFALLPGVRRAMSASDLIAQLERQTPRSVTRRTAELGLPSYVVPRDRRIPE